MGIIQSIINLIRDIAIEIIAGLLAGYMVFLYFGTDIEEKIAELYPNLPVLLIVLIGVSFIGASLVRGIKSVKYHRKLEKDMTNLQIFLEDWDNWGNAFSRATQSRTNPQTNEFNNIRSRLQFNYSKVSHLTRIMRYDMIDRVTGIHARNYDVIGNLLAESPFSGEWFQLEYRARDFSDNWDRGRTVLVSVLGMLEPDWNSFWHRIWQLIKLVPRTVKIHEIQET